MPLGGYRQLCTQRRKTSVFTAGRRSFALIIHSCSACVELSRSKLLFKTFYLGLHIAWCVCL